MPVIILGCKTDDNGAKHGDTTKYCIETKEGGAKYANRTKKLGAKYGQMTK